MLNAAQRIVVTGMGLVSAAGVDTVALVDALRHARTGLQPITAFSTEGMVMTHAGEVPAFDPVEEISLGKARSWDRGTQMALVAARQAMAQATGAAPIERSGVGVAIGVSGATQYQNVPVMPDRAYPLSRRVALYVARSNPAFQADVVARACGLSGARLAFSSASLGSLLAVAHAADLIRAGHVTAMLAGGGEIQTLLNALGMDVLGLGARGPCQPFSKTNGMSFGEGAAFVCLESLEAASRRGAVPLAELFSAGVSADAYNEFSNDPTGNGLARAIQKALDNGYFSPADIAWIRVCGTGHRSQDAAEVYALRQCFKTLPPVTSTEPYFGHVNGVAPVLGLVAGICAQMHGVAPSMPLTDGADNCWDLPLLPAGILPAGAWLLNAVAFGGSNGALIAGPLAARALPVLAAPVIEIAGVGVVHAMAMDAPAFLASLRSGQPSVETAQLINDACLRSLPGIEMRRRERIMRWAITAVHECLKQGCIASRGSARVGLLVGVQRGPQTPQERFFARALKGEFDASNGRELLRTARFSVASEIAQVFGIKGYSGTLCPGVNGGVQLAAHGAALLAANPDLDALVVLAADEWSSQCTDLYAALGRREGKMHAYGTRFEGVAGAEGAAALLLVKRVPGRKRGLCRIAGAGFSGDTGACELTRAMQSALGRAALEPRDLDFGIGLACGWPDTDRREVRAVQALKPDLPMSSVLDHTGLAEAAGGLFAVIAAVGALQDGMLAPMASDARPDGRLDFVTTARRGNYRRAIVFGSAERGANAALVLERCEPAPA